MRSTAASGWSPNSCAIRPAQPRTPNWRTAALTLSASAAGSGASDRCRSETNSASHRASWWETLRSPQEKMPQREACLAGGYIATRLADGKSVRFKRAK